MGPDARGCGPAFDAALGRTRAEVDRVLLEMPDNPSQARCVVTREWGFVPRPEELQTIAKIAHEPIGQGSLREMSRATLSLRVLVDQELRELLDAQALDARRLETVAAMLPELQRAVAALEFELRATLETQASAEREFLLQVGNALIPQHDALVAAEVLAPRLAELARAGDDAGLRAVAPELDEQEIACLSRAVRGPGDEEEERSGDAPSRVCIDALALATVIHDDLAEWNFALDGADADGGAGIRAIRGRLERTKTAYHVVSNRLQKQQDAALVAGLNGFAEELRRVQHRLFSGYLRLKQVLNTGGRAAEGTGAMNRLLEECSNQEARVEVEQGGIEVRREKSAPALMRERARLRMLTRIAAVLCAACLVIYAVRHGERPGDALAAPIADLPETMIPAQGVAAGPMMYAEVSHGSWDGMSEAERTRTVLELGQSAAGRGYDSVYVLDEEQRELARWTRLTGVTLARGEGEAGPGS
jgi:hypothetical protein